MSYNLNLQYILSALFCEAVSQGSQGDPEVKAFPLSSFLGVGEV